MHAIRVEIAILIIIPIKLDWHKQLATDIMLETPAISGLWLQWDIGAVVSIDHNCELFFGSLDIITSCPIGTFLKLHST
jgi:hypothetical protein